MQEKKLEKQIEQFQELAKENKNIDIGALMLNALEHRNQNLVSAKWKRWAYIISISLPPLGLLFAAKYYFSSEDDAKQVANICVLLTVVSVLLFVLLGKIIFSSAGVSLDQIQQIKPQDMQQLLQ